MSKNSSGTPYNPQEVEPKSARKWERAKAFRPSGKPQRGRTTFSMVFPPPNVTGSLHMGHALNASMQDVLARYHRMRGDDTLWVPGMDHAGIATQNVVEKQLQKEGKTRHDLGREKFVERVWEWKKEYGNTIKSQLQRLGASFDWSRERFTMDTEYVSAVQEAFIHYAKNGYIYRGKRLVNWCPRCTSSISDLEVKYEERDGHLYTIVYTRADGKGELSVTTTRPETLLGDTGVAVHPKDARYASFVGKEVLVPLTGRAVPVVADHAVEKEFGSGVVKVTPAHDHTDWQIGKRHRLPVLNVIGEDGHMTPEAGSIYAGLSIEEARARVVDDLRDAGLLADVVPIRHSVTLCDRCGTVIQPLVSLQWFVRMDTLSPAAVRAAQKGDIHFHPPRWKKAYTTWFSGVEDWCISRQLWWGHRLPVWYCKGTKENPASHVVFSVVKPKKCSECGASAFVQDADVLDTWFSAALWPFAVLGWPKTTTDLLRYYPTSVLATARDILYLWVARMAFSGMEFMNGKTFLPARHFKKTSPLLQVPFRHVLIHPTVLNKQGQRMSKSLGTGVDPMSLIAEYGADATRFGLLVQTQYDQQALKFDDQAVKTGRNVVNKLWNIGKYIKAQKGKVKRKKKETTAFDVWILGRLYEVTQDVEQAIETFHFGDALRILHAFLWDDVADWYIEASKVDGATSPEVLQHVFLELLALLHPFLPHATEELWSMFGKKELLARSSWPVVKMPASRSSVPLLQKTIRAIRRAKHALGLAPQSTVSASVRMPKKLLPLLPVLFSLARLTVVSSTEKTILVYQGSGVSFGIAHAALSNAHLQERLADIERQHRALATDIAFLEKRLRAMKGKASDDVLREQEQLKEGKAVLLSEHEEMLQTLRRVHEELS